MHSYSVRLISNPYVRKDDKKTLSLQVIINRARTYVPLSIHWPANLVQSGKILPRFKDDQEHSDAQMIILSQMSKANEIFKIYRIQDKILTPLLFQKEFSTFARRKSFLTYMEYAITKRRSFAEITERTATNHLGTLNKLRKYRSEVFFHEIDKEYLQEFAHWLRSDQHNAQGAIWTRIKDIYTYLALADNDGMPVNSDYKNFQNKTTKGRIVFLDDQELSAMIQLFNSKTLDNTRHQSLRAFLFSCFTSLRISDVVAAEWSWVNNNNELVFQPAKNKSRIGKELRVPLSRIALALIESSRGYFFQLPSEQEINRSLKDICARCKIRKRITFHTARHTFATNYYRHTLDVVSLQNILGHTKVITTMVYVHLNDIDKRRGIDKMDEAFSKTLPVNRLVG